MTQTVLINGKDIRTYGINVLKIEGVLDMPSRLGTFDRNWKDVDGIEPFVELSDLYFSQRKIKLHCIMEALDAASFQLLLGQLRDVIYDRVTITTPYSVHDCILKEGAKVKWSNDKYEQNVVAQFTLIFNEITYDFDTTLPPVPNITNDLFWIDEVPLSDFGIIVEESDGNFDIPKMKTDKVTRFKRQSDKINKREARNISLKCTMFADNIIELQQLTNKFHSLLAKNGLRKLMIPLPGIERPYEVFCADGYKISKISQSQTQVAAMFTLILKEPEPKTETFFLTVLLDTTGQAILTTDGIYILVVADKRDTQKTDTYLFDPSESQEDTYLWTTNEIDETDLLYNELAKEIYLFTDDEIGQ